MDFVYQIGLDGFFPATLSTEQKIDCIRQWMDTRIPIVQHEVINGKVFFFQNDETTNNQTVVHEEKDTGFAKEIVKFYRSHKTGGRLSAEAYESMLVTNLASIRRGAILIAVSTPAFSIYAQQNKYWDAVLTEIPYLQKSFIIPWEDALAGRCRKVMKNPETSDSVRTQIQSFYEYNVSIAQSCPTNSQYQPAYLVVSILPQ